MEFRGWKTRHVGISWALMAYGVQCGTRTQVYIKKDQALLCGIFFLIREIKTIRWNKYD